MAYQQGCARGTLNNPLRIVFSFPDQNENLSHYKPPAFRSRLSVRFYPKMLLSPPNAVKQVLTILLGVFLMGLPRLRSVYDARYCTCSAFGKHQHIQPVQPSPFRSVNHRFSLPLLLFCWCIRRGGRLAAMGSTFIAFWLGVSSS